MIRLAIITLIVFLMNIPFGYWRGNVRKFSWQWVLSIHIPVPIIVALRIFSGIGFAWYTYVFLVSAFLTGQKLGAILHNNEQKAGNPVTSCLFEDIRNRMKLRY